LKKSEIKKKGPCQFPALGFVVDQYDKVQNFIPEPFWFIFVTLEREESSVEFRWKRGRLFDWHAAFVLYELCARQPDAVVLSVETKPTSKWRVISFHIAASSDHHVADETDRGGGEIRKPLPLTTVELQKTGSRLLRLTPKRVLDVSCIQGRVWGSILTFLGNPLP
jgi:DNA topoisomerase III